MMTVTSYKACKKCKGVAIHHDHIEVGASETCCLRCGYAISVEPQIDKGSGLRKNDQPLIRTEGGFGVQMLYHDTDSVLHPLTRPVTREDVEQFHQELDAGSADPTKSFLLGYGPDGVEVHYGHDVLPIFTTDYKDDLSDVDVLEPALLIAFWGD